MSMGTPSPQSTQPSAPAGTPVLTYPAAGSQAPTPVSRPIPKWVGFMVALAIVGSMLTGGGLWAVSYYNKPDPKNLREEGIPITSRAITSPVQQPSFAPLTPGIQQVSAAAYRIVAGDFTVVVSKLVTPNDWRFTVTYMKGDLITADQRVAILARNRYASDPFFAKQQNITEEQITKLKALPAVSSLTPVLPIAPADQEKLKAAWNTFLAIKGPKPADGEKVTFLVQELGKASLATMRATLGDTAKKAQEILSTDQLAPFK